MNECAPLLGTLCFAAGGLCGALFAVPLRRVKGWRYESYWLVYAVFGMVALPLVLSLAFVPDLFGIFSGEWKGTNAKTKAFLAVGIIILLSAFSVISMGKAT